MSLSDDHTHELAELRARVDALEQAVQAGLGTGAATVPLATLQPGADAGPPAVSAPNAVPSVTAPAATGPTTDVFWALNALKSMVPAPGAVLYTGSVSLPGGGAVDWQYALTTEDILARDWSRPSSTSALAALGHPVRLRLLQAIATGTVAVSELAALEGVGTTGQVYHHVNQLIAAGWVYSTSRGHYGIPPEKVVPLLTVVLAAGGI
ncbi:ArsR family transcriptional regulator [Cryobacterium lactosi]|uniref:ArsR family transcriptional regulator n=1 Tax=Cryobacterium lactosi TaxID=1259202 RepID=A0A4R9BGV3_9MICO|nr:winged helix-turn-helix domain-containing protein [Cryobacterium lactosi]TFD83935.1 ArsR family transcriptional regulator [Cryobacterium lactosi]